MKEQHDQKEGQQMAPLTLTHLPSDWSAVGRQNSETTDGVRTYSERQTTSANPSAADAELRNGPSTSILSHFIVIIYIIINTTLLSSSYYLITLLPVMTKMYES